MTFTHTGKLVNFPLRAVEEGRLDRLVLVQSEPLMAVAGAAAKKKDGQTVSGDTEIGRASCRERV